MHQILWFSAQMSINTLWDPTNRPQSSWRSSGSVRDLLVMMGKSMFNHIILKSVLKYKFCLRQNLKYYRFFDQNRIRTYRDQFLADFGVRGLYLRHRDCIRQLPRVTDTQKSVKTVWDDQIEWEDPARTCLCVVTRRTPEAKIVSKRLQMSHKRLVLGLSVCKIPFTRT